MTIICACCGLLKEASLHTSNGWLCNPCERSASTIVQVYVIRGQRFHKLLKGVEVKTGTAGAANADRSERQVNR